MNQADFECNRLLVAWSVNDEEKTVRYKLRWTLRLGGTGHSARFYSYIAGKGLQKMQHIIDSRSACSFAWSFRVRTVGYWRLSPARSLIAQDCSVAVMQWCEAAARSSDEAIYASCIEQQEWVARGRGLVLCRSTNAFDTWGEKLLSYLQKKHTFSHAGISTQSLQRWPICHF